MSWLQRWLPRSCRRSRLAECCTDLGRQSRSAFWLGFPNLHQRRPRPKMLLRQWLLRLCYRRRQMRLWGPRINQRRTVREFPIRLKLRPRISNSLKLRAANRRSLRPKTLSRPLLQAQLRKIPLKPSFLIHPRKLPRPPSPPLALSRVHVIKRNASLRHRYLGGVQYAYECLE